MIDSGILRQMVADNATDYVRGSRATKIFFGAMQNKLYRYIVGMDAKQIMQTRRLMTWPGRADGKPVPSAKHACRKVAKNYLTAPELRKLERLVGRLCLRAEDVEEDGVRLSLSGWRALMEAELSFDVRNIAA